MMECYPGCWPQADTLTAGQVLDVIPDVITDAGTVRLAGRQVPGRSSLKAHSLPVGDRTNERRG